MKQQIKIVKQSKSQYSISIPMKIIKEFGWNNDTYLEITESKNGISLTAASTTRKLSFEEKNKGYRGPSDGLLI